MNELDELASLRAEVTGRRPNELVRARELLLSEIRQPSEPARARRSRPGVAARLRTVPRLRLALAGGVAVAVSVAISVGLLAGLAGPAALPQGSARPTVANVRTAVLDAFERHSGDIMYATRTTQQIDGPKESQQIWTYPAMPVPGQRIRVRLFDYQHGKPVWDAESIYVAGPQSDRLVRPTTGGPRVAEIIDVQYATRTWSRLRSPAPLVADNLSPGMIRQQIASGGFTVAGTVHLQGRPAVELTWSRRLGPRMVITTRLWVDARTYLPLRSVDTQWVGASGQHPIQMQVNGKRVAAGRHLALFTDTTEYHMLPATPANLALLTPPIPAGFARTACSPQFAPCTGDHAARRN